MRITSSIRELDHGTTSTFLVARSHCDDFLFSELENGLDLSEYLHRLLHDPFLVFKLRILKTKKWKKTYQRKGQDLQRIDFVPDEGDWARISMISNATGFSRCYIFVFLMLIDRGIRSQPPLGTLREVVRDLDPRELFCSIFLDEKSFYDRNLTRVLQT